MHSLDFILNDVHGKPASFLVLKVAAGHVCRA